MQRYYAVLMASKVYGKLRSNYESEVGRLFDEKLSGIANDADRQELLLAKEKALTHKSDLRRSARLGVATVAAVVKGYTRGNIFPSEDVLRVGTYLEQIVSGADIDDEADDEKSTLTPAQYRANKTAAKYLIDNGENGLQNLGVIDEYRKGKEAVVIGQNTDLEFGRLLKEEKFEEIIRRKGEFISGWEQKIGRRGIAYWLARVVYDGLGGKPAEEKEIVADHLGNCGQIWQVGDDMKDFRTDIKAFADRSAKIVPANSIIIEAIDKGAVQPHHIFNIISVLKNRFDIVEDWYIKNHLNASRSLLRWSDSGTKGSHIYAAGALDFVSHQTEKRMEDLKMQISMHNSFQELLKYTP